MARPRKIDRERLLDLAEEIIATASHAALTFGGLAGCAGMPKASVQSAFGTREALIDEMPACWMRTEQERFDRVLDGGTTRSKRVRTHIETVAEDAPE